MVDVEEKLAELAADYDVDKEKVRIYYNAIKTIPCTNIGDEDNVFECLERVLQDVASNDFIRNTRNGSGKGRPKPKSLEYSISSALYEVYAELSVPFLCEDFIKSNQGRFIF